MKNIHILQTKESTRIFETNTGLQFSIIDKVRVGKYKGFNIYITSDEEIKDVRPHEGKWQLEKGHILNKFPTYLTDLSECKLVIMTTDPTLIADGVQAIGDEFMEWFVKNPGCEWVDVDTYTKKIGVETDANSYREMDVFCKEHRIKIPQTEQKQHLINMMRCDEELGVYEEPKHELLPDFKLSSKDLPQEFSKLVDENFDELIGEESKQDWYCPKCQSYVSSESVTFEETHQTCNTSVIIEEPKQEIWKDIPNYEGLYQVSDFGVVKSLKRYVKGKVGNRLQKEKILSKRLVGNIGNQYYAVTLYNNKDKKQIKVSVLVAMAFLNHTPNGYIGFTVDHIDNNPLNNNVDNLQVITKRENSSKDRKGISKYTGVTFNKKSNKWRSQIWINGKNKTLGCFDNELEAHRAYQKELQQHLKS